MKQFTKFVLLTLVGLMVFPFISVSQSPPCFIDYYGLTFNYSHLKQSPSLSSDMPYDVIFGYIALDSIRQNLSESEVSTFLNRQTYNDTLRYLMKYLYKIVDYNPILFALTTSHWYDHGAVLLNTVIGNIHNSVYVLSPYPYLDKLLLKSAAIVHVRAEDTLRMNDSNSQYPTVSIVTCSVRDTIKGKVLPKAKYIYPENSRNSLKSSVSFPDNYMQFSYRHEWGRVSQKDGISNDIGATIVDDEGKVIYPLRMMDSLGGGWVKKDKEYIVFLDFHLICKDEDKAYFSFFPFLMYSAVCNVYPIEDGFVIDPENELGFGKSVEVGKFKDLIRRRIVEIMDYGN